MIEIRLRALFASLAVHAEAWIIEEPTRLLDAGESLVAFGMLVDNLYDAEEPLFRGEVAEIEALGDLLNCERRAWRLVHELEAGREYLPQKPKRDSS